MVQNPPGPPCAESLSWQLHDRVTHTIHHEPRRGGQLLFTELRYSKLDAARPSKISIFLGHLLLKPQAQSCRFGQEER